MSTEAFSRIPLIIYSGGAELPASLVLPKGEVKSAVLFLPGGGNTQLEQGPLLAGRKAWQERIAVWGVASLAFDYRGIEGTGIELGATSLTTRTEDAVAAYDVLQNAVKTKNLFAIGVSMGAVAAIYLTQERDLTGICLVCPAAYSLAAHAIPFGSDFTTEIRKDDDCSHYSEYSVLSRYDGRLLLAYGGKDVIIPTDIIDAYKKIVSVKNGVIQLHPEAAHFMNKEDAPSLEAHRALAVVLRKFLTGS